MQTDFWVLFPIPASQFLTKARLLLRTTGIGLMPLSYGGASPLRSDEDLELDVTLNGKTCPIRVSRDGTLIQVKLQAHLEPTDTEGINDTMPASVVPRAYNYVNRFLDIVRLVTGDPQMPRVGRGYPDVLLVIRPSQHNMDPQVHLVYGPRPEPEEYAGADRDPVLQRLDSAIGKDEVLELPLAEQRLSAENIERIRSLCADESALPAWDYLLSSARHSFHHGAYREALLNSHMAIEARVDSLIYVSLSEKGLEQRRAEDFLSDTSFKYKVTVCLPALCGAPIDAELLDRILNLHGRRNHVAHLGAQVFHREASRALSTGKKTLAALEGRG